LIKTGLVSKTKKNLPDLMDEGIYEFENKNEIEEEKEEEKTSLKAKLKFQCKYA